MANERYLTELSSTVDLLKNKIKHLIINPDKNEFFDNIGYNLSALNAVLERLKSTLQIQSELGEKGEKVDMEMLASSTEHVARIFSLIPDIDAREYMAGKHDDDEYLSKYVIDGAAKKYMNTSAFMEIESIIKNMQKLAKNF